MKTLYCNNCNKETTHTFNGMQKFPKFVVEIYTCIVCSFTRTVRDETQAKAKIYGEIK